MSNKGTPLRENPLQAAVDAELAIFEEKWAADHPIRPTVNLDAHGEQWGGGDATADKPTGITMTQWRNYLQEKRQARRDFIRTNPVIQQCLAAELKSKIERIRSNQVAVVAATGIFARFKKWRARAHV